MQKIVYVVLSTFSESLLQTLSSALAFRNKISTFLLEQKRFQIIRKQWNLKFKIRCVDYEFKLQRIKVLE